VIQFSNLFKSSCSQSPSNVADSNSWFTESFLLQDLQQEQSWLPLGKPTSLVLVPETIETQRHQLQALAWAVPAATGMERQGCHCN
jgi:hypothetical protein